MISTFCCKNKPLPSPPSHKKKNKQTRKQNKSLTWTQKPKWLLLIGENLMTEQIPNRNTTWIFVRLHHWTLSLPKVPCGTKCHHMLNIWSINVLACKTTGQQTRLWAKLGEEYTGKGLEGDRTHQPDGDEGPQARGAMPRGCLMPVLQGGHRDWYPGLSQSSKIHMPPPWWSFSTGLKRGGPAGSNSPPKTLS